MVHLSIILVALAGVATAQQDARVVIPFDFSGGLNLRDKATQIEAKYATGNSYNFDFLPTGVAVKRAGSNLDAATSIPNGLGGFDRGMVYVGEAGVYVGDQLISLPIGSAIRDSTVAGRLHPDSLAVTVFDERVFIASVGNNTTLACNVWMFNRRYNLWTRYTGWKPTAWAQWRPTTHSALQLYWLDRATPSKVFQYDETLTADDNTSGTASNITAELVTPAFNFGGDDGIWEELQLRIDTNDSIRVSFQIGAYDSVFTISPDTLGLTGPKPIARSDSTFKSGVPKVFIVPIRATGQSCQATIWTQGTGRCTVYPSAIVARRKRI